MRCAAQRLSDPLSSSSARSPSPDVPGDHAATSSPGPASAVRARVLDSSGAHVKTKAKRWVVAIVGIVVGVGILVGVKAGQIVTMVRAGESMVPPAEGVSSAIVHEDEWERTKPAIGSLVAVRGVTVGAELPGTVRQIG